MAPTVPPLLEDGRQLSFNDRRFDVEEYVGSGLSGQVYRVSDGIGRYAVKVFVPIYALQSEKYVRGTRTLPALIDIQQTEYSFLTKLSHPNIITVYDHAVLPLESNEKDRLSQSGIVDVNELPMLLLDFIDGTTLRDALDNSTLDCDSLPYVFGRVAKALRYLHKEKQHLHCDLKAANIMIRRADNEPVIVDFALSRSLDFKEVDPSDSTILAGAWYLIPENIDEIKKLKVDETDKETFKRLLFPHLDYYQFGIMIRDNQRQISFVSDFDTTAIQYYQELIKRLTDWNSVQDISPFDFERIILNCDPSRASAFGIQELNEIGSTEKTIQLPLGARVPITEWIEDLTNTRSWRRLTTINQLSLLSEVYPGCNYSRATHVLRSFDLSRSFVRRLFDNAVFRYWFDDRAVRQAMAVVLCHDINHYPFLHIFQESGLPHVREFPLFDFFCDGAATGERGKGEPSVYQILEDQLGMERGRFKHIMRRPFRRQTTDIDCIVKSLVDSGVDVDKLSYLPLDSHASGVPYGASIDVPCLIGAATIAEYQGRPHLAFDDSAHQAIENAVMTRFWNFRAMYWHHRNRSLMAMMLRTIRKLMSDGGLTLEEYLMNTMWGGDYHAVRFISERYQSTFDEESIIADYPSSRRSVFTTLHQLKTSGPDERDIEMYWRVKDLSIDQEYELCSGIAQELQRVIGKGDFGLDDVLVDVPRRDPDDGGTVLYVEEDGRVFILSDQSPIINHLSENYTKLAKGVRFFVSPRLSRELSDKYGKQFGETEEPRWNELIESVLDDVSKTSESV